MREFVTDIGGLQLNACQWGRPDAPPVLILHGWLDQALSWQPIANALANRGYCVYALDQRGHGLSEHAPRHSQYHFADYVADVDSWLSRNALSSIALIGHSMGGTVASLVASACSEKVLSLMLIEGLGVLDEEPQDAAKRFLTHVQQRRLRPSQTVFKTKDAAIERFKKKHQTLSLRRCEDLATRVLESSPDGWRWTWDPRHKHKSAFVLPPKTYQHLLAGLNAPTAFVQGKNSPYSRWSRVEERLEFIPNLQKRYSIKGGHNLHFESPAELSTCIVEWLGRFS